MCYYTIVPFVLTCTLIALFFMNVVFVHVVTKQGEHVVWLMTLLLTL